MLEILISPTTPLNGRRLLQAFHHSAPSRTRLVGGRPTSGSVLMLYGMGAPERYELALRHVRQGGTVVAWDIGYWNRKGPKELRNLRVSFNGMHCPQFVMSGPLWGAQRWEASGLGCDPEGGHRAGPVVLVGNGPKSNAVGARGWAAAKAKEIRQKMPGVRIVYRPKPKRPPDFGVDFDAMDAFTPIDLLLSRASLVVCRHSNVAVDACRLGVPVVCEDGAAAAIYPQRLEDRDRQPTHATRAEFLRRLAWWQWTTIEAEAGLAWPWLNEKIEEVSRRELVCV